MTEQHPPSLREQALEALEAIENMSDQYVQFDQDIDTIRRALNCDPQQLKFSQHPLTEEIMYKIHRNHAGYCDPFGEDDMRGAADWQLEQVIRWLRIGHQWDKNLSEAAKHRGGCGFMEMAIALEKAMRPQQEETNG